VNSEASEYQLTEQVSEVELAKREVRARKIAADEEINDVWCRFGP
jgi:hypothetical protein